METTFQKSDAWLLLAVVMASNDKQASLQQIMDTGDYINHAVFSEEELESGLLRLEQAGLLTRNGERVLVNQSAFDLQMEASKKAKDLFKIMDNLELLLTKKSNGKNEDK